jgi:hypothetical protein
MGKDKVINNEKKRESEFEVSWSYPIFQYSNIPLFQFSLFDLTIPSFWGILLSRR